jgi:hypothetical protein
MNKHPEAPQTPRHERQPEEAGVLQWSESTLLVKVDRPHNE